MVTRNTMARKATPTESWKARITPGAWILCDLDGTLVHTDYANYLSYRKAVEVVTGGSRSLAYSPTRRVTRTNLRSLVPGLSEAEYERIVALKQRCEATYLPYTILHTALAAFLDEVSRTNPVVLATNCSERRARLTLAHHGLCHVFQRVLCSPSRVGTSDPAKHAIAIAALGLDPQTVVVFDDDPAALQEAAAVGVPSDYLIHIQWRPLES